MIGLEKIFFTVNTRKVIGKELDFLIWRLRLKMLAALVR